MTTVCGKRIIYECVACVCLTFVTLLLVIAFFMAIEILMGVMSESFALPIDFYKFLPKPRMVKLQKNYLKDSKLLV